MVSLFDTLKNDFPPTQLESTMDMLCQADKEGRLKNWKDFANLIAKFHEDIAGDEKITVRSSSTWAITQEFLGKLTDEDDINYTARRSGHWHSSFDLDSTTFTFRELMDYLKRKFP